MHINTIEGYDDHAHVNIFRDKDSGLTSIVAIHRFASVPALGGCRMVNYPTMTDAISDALRLSRAMSYKAAVADYPFIGGKSVIMGDPKTMKNNKLLKAMARSIDRLGGRYITGEDVGITMSDVAKMKQHSPHFVGLQSGGEEELGVTAEGVFVGLKRSVETRLGKSSLDGLKVAIQGVGKVGSRLAERLVQSGAEVFISDVRDEVVSELRDRLGAVPVSSDEIFDVDADVFAPCALGGAVNEDTLVRLKVAVIAGAANNQLSTPRLADAVVERGILYAPDYVINAGGMMNVAEEILGYDKERLETRIAGIGDTLSRIYQLSDAQGINTHMAANSLAEDRIEKLISQ